MIPSRQVCDTIGCTYRQLDYLTRCGVKPAGSAANPGSGARRMWAAEQVVRLALAYHLTKVMPGTSTFPDVAPAALDNDLPAPPRRGYAMMAPDPIEVRWAATWADVRRMVEDWGAAVIVTYDLDALVGDQVDLDALPR